MMMNQVPSLSIRVARVVIILQTSLAPALAQRLILNLRSIEKLLNGEKTEYNIQTLPSIDFAHGSVIGNIGAPLRVDEDDEDALHVDSDDSITTVLNGMEEFETIRRSS
ncbi:hypothetical protein M422DRAFT_249113 [Sphaerobolus stellatus SS14]|nr:hypothetical protein M422DRAFT_249113 [Sphaerobolus stellatus SS14]